MSLASRRARGAADWRAVTRSAVADNQALNAKPKEGNAMLRRLTAWVAVGGMVGLLAGSALAQAAKKQPDATVKLSEGSVAAGIGWSWGKGVLTYKGKTYPFKVEGLSVLEVGITKAQATGNVFNLKKVEDFDGLYGAGGVEGTAVKGAGSTVLKNEKGVVIELKSATKGASLKLALEGLKLWLAEQGLEVSDAVAVPNWRV
jgi:hypothetical protein